MVNIKIGNIFESNAEVLVNTVNCVGVMGKGIAQIFKSKYPSMFDEYKLLCDNKQLTTGKVYPYFEEGKLKVLNFPTKQHWKSPSKLEYIEQGLLWFVDHYKELAIESIAFPPLGCGNGGLDWETVGPMMYKALKDLPINIEIYAPFGTEKTKLTEAFLMSEENVQRETGVKLDSINKNWLLILKLVDYLEDSKYSVKIGRTIFQKICYVLTRSGTDTGLKFVNGEQGPYSDDIKNMITILSNNNLMYEKEEGKAIQIQVSESFKFDKSAYSAKDRDNANKTFDLFRRIKDTDQAEMITTLLFSFDQLSEENAAVTEDLLCEYVVNWKKKYATRHNENKLRELTKSLTSMQLLNVDYSRGYKQVDLY